MKNYSNLTTLQVTWCQSVTDELLDHLPTSLWDLHILCHKSNLTKFDKISRLTELRKLWLIRVPEINDHQVISICNACPMMNYLIINSGHIKKNPNLSNMCMKAMSSLSNLEHLELNFFGDKFTDKGVKQLAKIKTLRVLDLKRNDKVTHKCAQYLPWTTILFDVAQK
jgi:hypothetical protein